MGSNCTCGKNQVVIQPALFFSKPKKGSQLKFEKAKENWINCNEKHENKRISKKSHSKKSKLMSHQLVLLFKSIK